MVWIPHGVYAMDTCEYTTHVLCNPVRSVITCFFQCNWAVLTCIIRVMDIYTVWCHQTAIYSCFFFLFYKSVNKKKNTFEQGSVKFINTCIWHWAFSCFKSRHKLKKKYNLNMPQGFPFKDCEAQTFLMKIFCGLTIHSTHYEEEELDTRERNSEGTTEWQPWWDQHSPPSPAVSGLWARKATRT